MSKNRLIVNDIAIEVEDGARITLRNGVLYVDGNAVQSQLSGEIHVHWHGDLASLQADGSVTCRNVDGNVTAGGSVNCRNIEGSVNAGGSVHARRTAAVGFCGDIKVTSGEGDSGGATVRIGHGDIQTGDVRAGGSVHAKRSGGYGGNITAGGSVHLD